MKYSWILFVGFLLFSCGESKKVEVKLLNEKAATTETTEDFDWLLGKWKRLNEKEGKETFENWEKVSNIAYSGIGFTMQLSDTIWQEQLHLMQIDDNWNLTVKTADSSKPITFTGTSYNATEFTCENPYHDFPNSIKYWKNEDKLSALVSGGEMEIALDFERIGE